MEVGSVSRLSGPALVFNLSVEAPHTYFTGSEQVLSHNKVVDWLLKVARNHYDEGIATLHALQHLGKCGGRLGGPVHRGRVVEIGRHYGKRQVLAGGGKSEKAVHVSPGQIRYPDVTYGRAGRESYINVGETRLDGMPVSREIPALDDLAGTGHPTYFVPKTGPPRYLPWRPGMTGPAQYIPGYPPLR